MAKNTPDYLEGIEEGLKLAQKTHIPLEEVLKSFDKFFDKINSLKKVVRLFKDHHVNNLNINGVEMKTDKEKEENLLYILNNLEIEIKKGDK